MRKTPQSSSRMVLFTMASGRIVRSMVMENCSGLMEATMRADSLITKPPDLGG